MLLTNVTQINIIKMKNKLEKELMQKHENETQNKTEVARKLIKFNA